MHASAEDRKGPVPSLSPVPKHNRTEVENCVSKYVEMTMATNGKKAIMLYRVIFFASLAHALNSFFFCLCYELFHNIKNKEKVAETQTANLELPFSKH